MAFAGVPGPFAETERARLAELRSGAAEERAEVLLELGRHEEVLPDLTALVANHPLRERMRGLLMIALYRSGRHAEALRLFQDGRRVLAEELGIDPGSELSRIYQQVLTRDPALNLRPEWPEWPTAGGLAGCAAPGRTVMGVATPASRSRRSSRWTPRASPVAAASCASCMRCCRRPGPPTGTRRCRWWSSRVRREWARPRWPSASGTRWPGTSPTASCTSACAA